MINISFPSAFACADAGAGGNGDEDMIYEDRGDPAVDDWTSNDFTKDGEWHDLDCQGIIPVDTKLVHFRVKLSNTESMATAYFRKNGNVNTVNIELLCNQAAVISKSYGFFVAPDDARKIEYMFSDIGMWLSANLSVRGWFV